jgi:hypothetical protein
MNEKPPAGLPLAGSIWHNSAMEPRWPEREKTICSICGASFLARTAAETGGYCKRHFFHDNSDRVHPRVIAKTSPWMRPEFLVIWITNGPCYSKKAVIVISD